jgi:hypothetical protein
LHAEVIDQVREVACLVDERKAVARRSCLRVPAPVVGEAAVIAREVRDLMFPVFEAMDLAVDEDEVGPVPLELVVEVALWGRSEFELSSARFGLSTLPPDAALP